MKTAVTISRPPARLPIFRGVGGPPPPRPRRAQVLLVEQLLQRVPLDHPNRGTGGEIGDHQSRDSLLERVEVVLVLSVRAAVVERKDGDPGTRVLSLGPASRSPDGGPQQNGGTERNDRTCEHSMLLESESQRRPFFCRP